MSRKDRHKDADRKQKTTGSMNVQTDKTMCGLMTDLD